MRITRRTKTADVIPLLTMERMDYISKNIPPYPLEKPLLSMTVSEFIETLDETYQLGILTGQKLAYKAFGMLRSFNEEMSQISAFIDANRIPESEEQRRASSNVVFPDTPTAILIEVQSFLNLKSLEDAGNVPVSEWLAIHRHNSAQNKFQHNLSRIYEAKSREKRK